MAHVNESLRKRGNETVLSRLTLLALSLTLMGLSLSVIIWGLFPKASTSNVTGVTLGAIVTVLLVIVLRGRPTVSSVHN